MDFKLKIPTRQLINKKIKSKLKNELAENMVIK